MAIASATFALPVVFALFIFGSFLTGKIKISIKEDEIKFLEAKVNSASFGDAISNQKLLEQEKQNLKSSLTEVSLAISKHTQWSPVLETIVQNMPQTMILRNIKVKEESKKMKGPKDDDTEKMVDIVATVRILQLSLVGVMTGNCDREVRAFREALLADSELAAKLEDIRVAQEMGKVNDKEIITYEIFLVFKPVV
jgi:Tfp pilus assembly protein PilN